MTWTDDAWKEIAPIYKGIIDGPFVTELANGTLREDRFMEYMIQDKLYLNEYGRALSLIAARATTSAEAAKFSEYSITASIAEVELHNFYINNFNVTDEMKEKLKTDAKNPTNELYTSFLLRHAALSPLPIAVAAVLPCFWIYSEVGHYHLSSLAKNPQNRYAKWIETYGGDSIQEHTEVVKGIINKLAEKADPDVVKAMHKAFITASICELKFWQAAYDYEKWL